MTKVRVAGFSISLDGFGAGPEQSLENPLGKRGRELHQWFLGTRTFRAMTGEGGGSDGVDEAYARRSMDGFGAFILGRNMFGPIRGPWPDQSWKGWWGANPPYHAPTFVLTHYPRDPIEINYYEGPPDGPSKLARIFNSVAARLLFAGHYHHWMLATPEGIDAWNGRRPLRLYPGRYFVVVGAICDGRFAIFDTDTSELIPFNQDRALTVRQ